MGTFTKRNHVFVLLLAVCMVGSGCSTTKYKASADKEAYALIEEKAPQVPNMSPAFSIESSAQEVGVDGAASVQEADPALGETAEQEIGAPVISLEQALSLAVTRNRQYQGAKEQLYLQALSLSIERHRYNPIFDGGASAELARSTTDVSSPTNFSRALAEAGVAIDALEQLTGSTGSMLRQYADLIEASGAEFGLTDPDTEIAGQRTARGNASVGLDLLLKGGGRIALGLTTNVLRYLIGGGADSSSTSLTATFTQPLLRGAGSEIAAERLTQAERDLLYALREFTLFRKDFTVDICSAYFGVLRDRDVVRNSYQSYLNFQKNAARERAFASEGRRTQAELGRIEQAELSAENAWVNALRSYREGLDRFKIQLGLSTDSKLALDDRDLSSLREKGLSHPALSTEEAVKVALVTRLDFYTDQDNVEDAARRVKVAANALKPGLDLVAQAGASSEGDNQPANIDLQRGTWSLGADVDLPFDRKSERNNYRAALIAQEQALRNLSLAEDNVKLQVRAAWRNLDQARRNYEVAVKGVQLNERRVEEQDLLAELGRATVLNQVDAQQDLTAAQNDLTAALVAHNIARLEFWRDMGILYIKEDGQWEEVKDGNPS
jgi:outer membrane protein TolC